MHAVRVTLLEAQAKAAGLPLWQIPLPSPCSNEEYEHRMGDAAARAVAEDFTHFVAFGDLFLEDVRQYRERQLAPTKLEPLFPLWRSPTDQLAREMIAGREFDLSILAAGRLKKWWSATVDPHL